MFNDQSMSMNEKLVKATRFACLVLLVTNCISLADRSSASDRRMQTIHEHLANDDLVVIAELLPSGSDMSATLDNKARTFRIRNVLRGDGHIQTGELIVTKLESDATVESFLVYSSTAKAEPSDIEWSNAYPISGAGIDYLLNMPADFPGTRERLTFFWHALEHEDRVVSNNAHLEFALATDEELALLNDLVDRETLMRWIENSEITINRRRLYFALLSLCGQQADGDRMEAMLSNEPTKVTDAMIACYITLTGETGIDWIDESILQQPGTDFAKIYSAIVALRYLGSKSDPIVSRNRIRDSLRLVLDMPVLADLVIHDLVEFEDWESIDRIAGLFDLPGSGNEWIRIPAILYMRACPLPEAEEYLREFERIDAKAVRRANQFFPPINDEESVRKRKPPSIRPRGREHVGPFC